MYFTKILSLKSFFSSINTGIPYPLKITFIKLAYVVKFLVITDISLNLYPSVFTSFIIWLAIFSISLYWLFAKNNFIFSTCLSYFLYGTLKILFSRCFSSGFLNLYKLFKTTSSSICIPLSFAISKSLIPVFLLEKKISLSGSSSTKLSVQIVTLTLFAICINFEIISYSCFVNPTNSSI